MNCSMAELKRALELTGFEDVKTVLSSGNAVFSARSAAESSLASKIEAALKKHLGKSFFTLVFSVDSLKALLESDPYAKLALEPGSKRVVTFLSEPAVPPPRLPVEQDGARILALKGKVAFSAYVKSPKGPVFMTLLERTFGKNITTRTWDTVTKVTR